MMLKPSIDSLLNRVNSKYSLVILASKRAHELDAGAQGTLDHFDSVKSVGKALEEIDDSYPKYVISIDKEDYGSNGIKHLNIFDFLMNDDF